MIKRILQDETGASVIEVAVIIVIMVILAGIFQKEIQQVLALIIAKITTQIDSMGTGTMLWFPRI